MSCETLNTQSVGLNVAIGNLPEGFCPATMQELAQAIAARLIVTPSQSFNGMAIGSIEPTSNVGLWFKNCEELFVFDDATARYVPLTVRGTFANRQYFIASGTFVVPDFVTQIRISAWGAGGGGGNFGGANVEGAGGGSGGYCTGIFTVLPAQAIPVTVGVGGALGTPGATGGATSCNGLVANGGVGGPGGGSFNPALGGTATGGDIQITGTSSVAGMSGHGGQGGSAPLGGGGGTFIITGNAAFLNGKAPGGGGSGSANAGSALAGNGANGSCLIEW